MKKIAILFMACAIAAAPGKTSALEALSPAAADSDNDGLSDLAEEVGTDIAIR